MALLIIAIAVDPLGAIAVIVGATLLGLALRPLRSAVRRRGEESARTGMRFASSLNEVSQLGQEVHIFRIQDQVQRLLYELVDDTAVAKRRLLFARHGSADLLHHGLPCAGRSNSARRHIGYK